LLGGLLGAALFEGLLTEVGEARVVLEVGGYVSLGSTVFLLIGIYLLRLSRRE